MSSLDPIIPPTNLRVAMPPVKPPAKRMGIRMGGCERPLEDLIHQHIAKLRPTLDRGYTLIEIGSAGCTTLRAFKDILSECAAGVPWRVLGFDLSPEKAWSLDWEEVKRAFDGVPHVLRAKDVEQLDTFSPQRMYLCLEDNPREVLKQIPLPIDFAFVDASHGKSCGFDFLAIEAQVSPGGLVLFHDYGEPEQGTDFQFADREFISVRSYVHRLGLASPSPSNVLRKGWRFVGEIKGSRHWGGDGNSLAVIQRTDEALQYQPELSLD